MQTFEFITKEDQRQKKMKSVFFLLLARRFIVSFDLSENEIMRCGINGCLFCPFLLTYEASAFPILSVSLSRLNFKIMISTSRKRIQFISVEIDSNFHFETVSSVLFFLCCDRIFQNIVASANV